MSSALDWNWFFSSVAQSVAALVGTLLAFVIASILNQQAAFGRRRDRITELLARSERLREEAGTRYFDWYNRRRLADALNSLESKLDEEEERRKPEDYYKHLHVSQYQSRQEVIAAIANRLDAVDAQKRQEAEARRRRAASSTGLEMRPPDFSMPSSGALQASATQAAADRAELEHEAELIDRFRIEVNDHIRALSILRREAARNPESSNLVRFTLVASGFLFALGVIYPLSFLPVHVPWDRELSMGAFFEILFSLRGVVLSLAVVIFSALVGTLWYINAKLRHSTPELEGLASSSQHLSYSPHLEAFRQNREPSPPLVSPTEK